LFKLSKYIEPFFVIFVAWLAGQQLKSQHHAHSIVVLKGDEYLVFKKPVILNLRQLCGWYAEYKERVAP
jgi:hypothetical protein